MIKSEQYFLNYTKNFQIAKIRDSFSLTNTQIIWDLEEKKKLEHLKKKNYFEIDATSIDLFGLFPKYSNTFL